MSRENKFLDDFDGFYEAAHKGWADRYHTNWISKNNPEGYVSSLWIRGHTELEVHSFISSDSNKRMFRAELDEKAIKGYFNTLEEAKIAAEKAYNKYVIESGQTNFCAGCVELQNRVDSLKKEIEKLKNEN